MAVGPVVDDDVVLDPDTLKMPENPSHRQAVDLIAIIGGRLLGDDYVVYRDMNWYPPDGEGPLAPDAMVLKVGVLPEGARSYRQDQLGGPAPLVAIEIPSHSNSVIDFRQKMARYHQMGVVTYVVGVDGIGPAVSRHDPATGTVTTWDFEPIPELGNLKLGYHHGKLMASNGGFGPVDSAEAFIESIETKVSNLGQQLANLDQALSEKDEALNEKDQALNEKDQQLAIMAAALRDAGIDPDSLHT